MKQTVTLDLKWYETHQNNSGGHFYVDAAVAQYVLVQATSAKEAQHKMEEITESSGNDWCECCGVNPYNVRLWLIGHCHGPVCAIWASHEQEALDNACDANMLECFLMPEEDIAECIADGNDPYEIHTGLGNASELHNLDDCWMAEVDMQAGRDIQLIVKLARASEGGHGTLDF